MARKPKLWTTYALKRFEQTGLEFEGWYNSDPDENSFLNRGSGDKGITVILIRTYSQKALNELLTDSRPDQYHRFLDGKITEFFSFYAENETGYTNFRINPAGKVVVEDRSPDFNKSHPGRLFPRKKEAQRDAADFLEQLVEYTERVLSPATKK